MNILFTSIVFERFAGSELVTLDQVDYFINQNDNVDIFTLESGQPLIDFLHPNARIIDPLSEDLLHSHYDLIIARQWPLLEYLIFHKGINADRVYFESISWRLPIDFYPYFYSDLTLCGYISKRIKKTLESMGYDTNDSFYFPNYTKKEFIDYVSNNDHVLSDCTPSRIAIVSNHIPNELEKAAEKFKERYQIVVDIYGMNHRVELITPKILENYDIVISIGKTIFYSLSMGIPSFLYDETCSIGYVSLSNYQSCLDGNMAGSEGYQTMDPEDIVNDVLSGYQRARIQSNELRECAKRDFLFDNLMQRFLDEIFHRPKMDLDNIRSKYPYAQYLSPVYINETFNDKKDILHWYNESLRLGSLVQEVRGEYTKLDAYKDQLIEELREQKTINDLMMNSKGWKLLEALRKPLRIIKSR